MCVFSSSRVDSGTEPIDESYDFDTTQEDPSLDPSVGFYPGEPLSPAAYIFAALPLSYILALLRCFVDTNPICMSLQPHITFSPHPINPCLFTC